MKKNPNSDVDDVGIVRANNRERLIEDHRGFLQKMKEGITEIETRESSRHYRGSWIRGNTKDVILEVAKRLESDRVTPMYEHMALQVVDVDVSDLPYRLGIRLFKNYYAGD